MQLAEKQSAEDFRIPATDTKGHSSRLWLRCIPSMARQVEQIVQSKRFPYRTKGDVLRHALHRHVNWLNRHGKVNSITGQVDTILEIMRDDEANHDFRVVFDKLADRIAAYLREQERGEAMRLILAVQNHIANMPDGFWKLKYASEVKRRYGELIGGARKANLRKME